MLNVLVTGGCGFIGSEFIRQQLALPDVGRVVNLDKLTYAGNPNNLADCRHHPHYFFHRGDIADYECVERLLQRYAINAIVNFAAESHVDRSLRNSTPFVQTNVVGTQVLLDVARQTRIHRYLQVSTDEVYGSLGPTGYFVEDTPLAPNSPYSASKAAADMLVRSYCHSFGFPGIITRCTNNYGPCQFPEKLIPLFITNLLANQPVPVYGTGHNVRDWIHVSDHCRGIGAALRQGTPGEIYLFGGRTEKTNLEITHLLLKLLDKPQSLVRYVTDRPGHDSRYAVDCSRSECALGWKTQIPFEEGLNQTIQWYCSNQSWVAGIKSGEYRVSHRAASLDKISAAEGLDPVLAESE